MLACSMRKLVPLKNVGRYFLAWLTGTLLLLGICSNAYTSDQFYTIKQGDTLWSISEQWLDNAKDWRKLQLLNNIKNPHKLTPNTQIRIPVLLLKKDKRLAVVKYIQGKVVINNHLGQQQSTVVGMALFEGDEVITGTASSVRIEFKDGSASLLQENSQLKIKKIEFNDKNRDVKLYLNHGSIDNKIKEQKPGSSKFKITTPSAVASVRGTSFRVTDNPLTQLFRAEVLDGSVAVSSQGEERLVKKGFGTIVKKGEPPSVPSKLLPSIDVANLQKKIHKKPILFHFTPLIKAIGYRVEISNGVIFNQQMFSQNISSPNINLSHLNNGQYIMRLFGYDKHGLGGKISYHQFKVNIADKILPPELPKLISPDDRVILKEKNFKFHWSASEKANAYRFQLASDDGFKQLLIDIFPYNFIELSISDRLPSGNYHWHVAALNKANKVESYTASRSFRIPPHIPILSVSIGQDDEAIIRWSKGKDSLRYRLQISTNKNFSGLMLDKYVPTTHYPLKPEILGNYYIRVSSVDTDGFLSETSNTQQVRLSKDGFFNRKLVTIDPMTEFAEF